MLDENKIIEMLINLAMKAFKRKEIPVSAILVCNNKIISKNFNLKESRKNAMAHAEILCIKNGTKKLKRWNLSDCDLYVSLKPCNMCMEVIKQSRIKNVYYLLDKLDYKHEFSKTNISKIENESNIENYKKILSTFFQNMR